MFILQNTVYHCTQNSERLFLSVIVYFLHIFVYFVRFFFFKQAMVVNEWLGVRADLMVREMISFQKY